MGGAMGGAMGGLGGSGGLFQSPFPPPRGGGGGGGTVLGAAGEVSSERSLSGSLGAGAGVGVGGMGGMGGADFPEIENIEVPRGHVRTRSRTFPLGSGAVEWLPARLVEESL